jgi:hypothetical protein
MKHFITLTLAFALATPLLAQTGTRTAVSSLPTAASLNDTDLLYLDQVTLGTKDTKVALVTLKGYVLAGLGGSVSSFNTRTGSVTLTAADINATGTINVSNLGHSATSGTASFSTSSGTSTWALGVPWSGVTGAPAFITSSGTVAGLTGTITAAQVSGLASTATSGVATSVLWSGVTGAPAFITATGTALTITGTIASGQVSGLASTATSGVATSVPWTGVTGAPAFITSTGTAAVATTALNGGVTSVNGQTGSVTIAVGGVTSFDTRAGSITLTAADVNATGTVNVTNTGTQSGVVTSTITASQVSGLGTAATQASSAFDAAGAATTATANLVSTWGTGVSAALGNATNGAGGVAVANSAGNLPNVTSRPVYVMANFQTGSNGNERGQIFMSFDALHWTQIRGLENYSPTLGGMRDIGLVLSGSTWYISYIGYAATGTATQYFGTAKSTDLVNWTHIADVTPVYPTGTANVDPIANPKIFTSSTGTRYVVFYDETTGHVYSTVDSTGTMGTFAQCVDITPSSGVTSGFDPWIMQTGATYNMFLKPGGYSSTYHCFTATSFPTTTWTDTGTITAWGGSENACVFTGPDGNYWAEMNNQGGNYQWNYSKSPSLTATGSWSALSVVTQPSIVAQTTAGTYWDGGTIIPVTDSNTIINLLAAAVNQTMPNLGITYQSEAFGAQAPGAPQLNTPLSIQYTGTYLTGADQRTPLTVDDLKIGTSTGTSTGTFNYISPGGTNVGLALNSIVTVGELTQYDTSDLFEVYGGKTELIADGAQLQLRGRTTPNKYLNINFDTSNNVGSIDAEWSGVATEPLALNPIGQNSVLVGTVTQSGADDLQIAHGGTALAGSMELTRIDLKGGPNTLSGTVTLSGGSGTITSTKLTTSMVVFLTLKTSSGTPGNFVPLTTISSGTCVVTGTSTDNSTYNWGAISVNN